MVLSNLKFGAKGLGKVFTTVSSGAKFWDFVLPGEPGTAFKEGLSDIPVVGGLAAEAFDIGASPLSLIPAARGASLAGRIGGRGLLPSAARLALTPIAPRAPLVGRLAVETGVPLAGLGAGRAIEKALPEDTNPYLKAGAALGTGLLTAGLTGVAASRAFRGTPQALTPQVSRQRLPTAEEEYELLRQTGEPPIESAGRPDIVEEAIEPVGPVIERGSIVRVDKALDELVALEFDVDRKLGAFIGNASEFNRDAAPPEIKSLIKDWFGLDSKFIREDAIEGGQSVQFLYQAGGRALRDRLSGRYPDGYVTLWRGERTSNLEAYLAGLSPEEIKLFDISDFTKKSVSPIFESDFPIMSFTSNPLTASSSFFTGQIVRPNSRLIIQRKVPISDIIAPGAGAEEEVLVLSREQISDEAWLRITGEPKNKYQSLYDELNPTLDQTAIRKAEVMLAPTEDIPIEGQFQLGRFSIAGGSGERFDEADVNPLFRELRDKIEGFSDAFLRRDINVATAGPFQRILQDYASKGIGIIPNKKTESSLFDTVHRNLYPATLVNLKTGEIVGKVNGDKALAQFLEKPFDSMGGGKEAKGLVKQGVVSAPLVVLPADMRKGLTPTERLQDIYERTLKVLIGRGVPKDEVATPLAREYSDMLSVLETQASYDAEIARLAIKEAKGLVKQGVVTGNILTDSPAFREVLERLQTWNETLFNMGVFKKSEIETLTPFSALDKYVPGWQQLDFHDAIKQMGIKAGGALSRKHLRNLLGELDLYVDEGGKVVPGVTGRQLPPKVAAVLNKEVNARKRDPDWLVINQILKSVWATMDFSFYGIQGLLVSASNPIVAAKATKASIRSLKDDAVVGEVIRKINRDALASGKPTVDQMVSVGLHLSGDISEVTAKAEGKLGLISQLPPIKQTNRLFTNTGDIFRIMMVQAKTPADWDMNTLRETVAAANRGTGYSRTPFGGHLGNAVLFAPRFLQSQLEVVAMGTRGLLPGATLEQRIAREQLLKLIAAGSFLTVAINEVRGEDTEFDPRNPNFMRVRDLLGNDISLFGPWDSLLRGVIKTASGDPDYMFRTKASPAVSIAWDILSGKTFLGEDIKDPKVFLSELILPFSVRQSLEDPKNPAELITSFFGVKASPLTEWEKLEKKMSSQGLEFNDPLQRRLYFAEHPEDVPGASTKEGKKREAIYQEFADRKHELEDRVQSDELSLVEFRNARKILSVEERSRLKEALGSIKESKNEQRQWINSYLELYDKASDKVTGRIDSDKFESLEAEWLGKHSQEALEYVQEFRLAGKGGVETRYLSDMRQLADLGYFNIKRYRFMLSDLNDKQLDSYRDIVSAARASDPLLSQMPFENAAWITLSGRGFKDKEIIDIINSGREQFLNPDFVRFKEEHNKILQWFNPNASWSSYSTAQPKIPYST
mgnify:CR=1 FL=1